jgi:hypothetical protein
MAATVGSIITEIKSVASSKLGSEWKEVPNVYKLSGTDTRRGSKSYGARPLAAGSTGTVTNAYALDHQFELVLMDVFPNKSDSAQAEAVISNLYDKQDEIFKQIARSKINLPTTVMLVSEPQLSEPEFINGQELIALRQQFNVRYRQTL